MRLLPLLGVALLCSCYEDEADECPDSGAPVTVQFKITAENADDLNGTRADEPNYEAGKDHEYISNLCVLIVQGNAVVEKLLLDKPDFDISATSDLAKAGNIKSCTSRELILDPGTYVIYAFANLNTVFDDDQPDWGSISGLEKGEEIPDDVDIDNMVLEDPAGKLNFDEGKFIPMSAKETVTVNSSTGLISIGLDRLVSKVRMRVFGPAGTTIESLTFSGYADKVALLKEKILGENDYLCNKFVPLSNPTNNGVIPEKDGDYVGYADFYVNATPASNNFTVTLTTDENGGTTYISTTTRDELPRNSIYPLDLTLNPYGLDLSGWFSVVPIGTVPIYFKAALDPNTYEVEIAEGAQFKFAVNTVTGSYGQAKVTSCEWTNLNDPDDGFAFTSDPNLTTVEGHVTARAGLDLPFNVKVDWNDGGHDYTRIYTVNVHTVGLAEVDWGNVEDDEPNLTRSAVWNVIPTPEVLNIFRNN